MVVACVAHPRTHPTHPRWMMVRVPPSLSRLSRPFRNEVTRYTSTSVPWYYFVDL